MRNEAVSYRQFAPLFLFFLLIFLLFLFWLAFLPFGLSLLSHFLVCLLALCFLVHWLAFRFRISSLHMPLCQNYACLMLNNTDRVDRVTPFLFEFQSPPLGFSINRHGICSSFFLVWLKQVHKQTTKRFF